MDPTTELASNFTVADYATLRDRLGNGDEAAWENAIDALERRITERFLRPINTLITAHDTRSRPGFAILALDCLLIDTIQSFKEGRTRTGEGSTAASFKAFLSATAFAAISRKDRDRFYNYIRNAILHNGETRGNWKIRIDTNTILTTDTTTGVRVVNRNLFHQAVEQEFNNLLTTLRDGDSDLRKRFLHRMDAIAGLTAPEQHHYFAYGSLLNQDEITKQAPNAEPISTAYLPNHRLEFTKHATTRGCDAATITQDPTSTVWGFIYRVNEQERHAIRTREAGYEEITEITVYVAQSPGDKPTPLTAFTYQARERCPKTCGPNNEYLTLIINGARARQLPETYIQALHTAANPRMPADQP